MFRESQEVANSHLGFWVGDGDDMAEWVQRNYSKGEIDKAGLLLASWWGGLPANPLLSRTEEEREAIGRAWTITDNWRSSHALPLLSFRMGLAHRVRKVQRNALIAQRMKRMSSILNKLAREPNMKLTQMHDLGGCRAVLRDVAAVYAVLEQYRGPEQSLFEEIGTSFKCYDYIHEPKSDGYRGIHVVGRYQPRFEKNEIWRGNRIEIQLRTQLQHNFATAVETVATFTQEPLKSGGGPERWRRFFALASSAFAYSEGMPLVPGTPETREAIVHELRELTRELRVKQRLKAWTKALKTLPRRNLKGAKWLLLVLNAKKNTIRVNGYSARQKAAEVIADIEMSPSGKELDAVLVWVNSAKTLRAAYPNYYADTRGFVAALEAALAHE